MSQPYLGGLYPSPGGEALPLNHPATVSCRRLAEAVGLNEFNIVLTSDPLCTAIAAQPPAILMPSALTQSPGDGIFRFWVGRAVCLAATPGALVNQLSDEQLSELSEALCSPRVSDPSVQQLRKQLSRSLPRKMRRRLEQLDTPVWSGAKWQRYRDAENQRADQVGLILCRDAKVALSELAQAFDLPLLAPASHERLARLMQFAVSEDFERLSRRVWPKPAA